MPDTPQRKSAPMTPRGPTLRRRRGLRCCIIPIPIVLLLIPQSYVILDFEYPSFSVDVFAGHNASLRGGTKRNPDSPKVLYTIFAGRKNRLLLQEPYWDEMYKIGAIDELHLWNYVTDTYGGHANESVANLNHLLSLEEKYSYITVMDPKSVDMNETEWFDRSDAFSDNVEVDDNGNVKLKRPNARSYSEYYKYYASNPYDGVVIKGDDDIVYINSTMVRPFAEYAWNHPEIFLLSASVVNQGLCAHYQKKYGGAIPEELIPAEFPDVGGLGALHKNETQAMILHTHFLASEENRRKFYITEPTFIPFHESPKKININFIAIRGDAWHEMWEIIQGMLRKISMYYDEEAITQHAIRTRGKVEGIYMPLVVAHASFSYQAKMHHEILSLWKDWASKERADFYGNLLDEWVAPERASVRETRLMSKFMQKLQADNRKNRTRIINIKGRKQKAK